MRICHMSLFVLLLALLMLSGCGHDKTQAAKAEGELSDKEWIDSMVGEQTEEELNRPIIDKQEPKQPAASTIIMAAAGDMLIHDCIYNAARTKDGYDFKPLFKEVKPYMASADLTFANQESMIGGAALGLSSYPSFNSPFEAGDALEDAGVDIVSVANNHTLDRGEQAVMRALKHWDQLGMAYTGAYKSEQDAASIRILRTPPGISAAYLAYTYGTNGIKVPAGKGYLVNLIDREKISRDLEAARKAADVVVLSLHFGNEYERVPNAAQKELVQLAADHGADVVLGHHPHVLQPIEWVPGKNGHQTLVAYSLGNFISGQKGTYKQTGGLLTWEVTKTAGSAGSAEIRVSKPAFMPTYVKYGEWKPRPMFRLKNEEIPGIEQAYADIKKHMSQSMPGLVFSEE